MKTIKYNNGMILLSDKPDGGSLITNNDHLINLHEPIEELIFTEIMLNNNINTYINLGVHVGYYSILAKLLSPKTKVIGFEGQKNFRKTIEKNIELNNVSDIEIHYKFLSTDNFYNKKDNEIILFSDFLKNLNNIDLISTDIQGAEVKILEDLINNNQLKKVKRYLIGTHDKFKGQNIDSHEPCLKLLKNSGYSIKYESKPRSVWLQPDGIIWAELC